MEESGKVIALADVRRELAAGNRVVLLVRHAERCHIDHEDKTFGATLPITDNGRLMAIGYGKALKGAAATVQFRSTPMLRTNMTARCIAQGMGIEAPQIVEDDEIGNGSAFVFDRLDMWRVFRHGNFFESMIKYMREGEHPGFEPIARAGFAYERHVLDVFAARLGVFVTHDIYITAYLHAKGIKRDWSPENWPRFLDTAVLILAPDGSVRREFLRAGFSDRAVGVDGPRAAAAEPFPLDDRRARAYDWEFDKEESCTSDADDRRAREWEWDRLAESCRPYTGETPLDWDAGAAFE